VAAMAQLIVHGAVAQGKLPLTAIQTNIIITIIPIPEVPLQALTHVEFVVDQVYALLVEDQEASGEILGTIPEVAVKAGLNVLRATEARNASIAMEQGNNKAS